MDGSFYAHGSQSVEAAFVELSAPVLRSLELDAAGRVDHYNTPSTSFTPKFGVKWTLLPSSRCAAPTRAVSATRALPKSGTSGTGSATTAPVDYVRCPYTNKPSDCGFGYAATLSVGNPNLKPEKSRSYTAGVVFEPVQQVNFTFDYYNIRRDDEIVPAPLGLQAPVRGAPQTLQDGTVIPGPIIYYPQPYVNAGNSETSGYDGALHVEVPAGASGD